MFTAPIQTGHPLLAGVCQHHIRPLPYVSPNAVAVVLNDVVGNKDICGFHIRAYREVSRCRILFTILESKEPANIPVYSGTVLSILRLIAITNYYAIGRVTGGK